MSAHEADRGPVRIGELSRRVGVTPEVLRAWERRYGILSPTRTDGGFRLYGEDDERRIRRMLQHLEQGLSAAEAARLARADPARLDPATGTDDGSEAPTAAALGEQLRHALDGFDDVGAHSALDRLLGSSPLESVLRDAVLPYLHELGERWARAEASVAQEHFASCAAARPSARPGARLGARSGSARAARVRSRRSTRSRVDLLRTRSARSRLADHLPRSRHPAAHADRDSGSAAACARRRQRHASRAGSKRSRPPARARLRRPPRARRGWNRCQHRRHHRCSMAQRRPRRSRGEHRCARG